MTEPAASTPAIVRRRSTMSALNVMLAVALLVAVGGVAFAAGRLTSPTSAAAGTRTTNDGQLGQGGLRGPNASGPPGGGFGRAFGGNVSLTGTVTATTPTSITISLPNGQTVTLATDSSTTYHQQVAGSSSDVTNGKQVIVQVEGRAFAPGASVSPAPDASSSVGVQGDLKAASITVVAQ